VGLDKLNRKEVCSVSKFWDFGTLIMLLIGIYLFLSRGGETVKIINSLASNSIKGIVVLQGRNVKEAA
jgi:hypothetical protein